MFEKYKTYILIAAALIVALVIYRKFFKKDTVTVPIPENG